LRRADNIAGGIGVISARLKNLILAEHSKKILLKLGQQLNENSKIA